MDGVLVVDKPRGLTSHDVVARTRRALGIRRIGHIGTLDPMATGVLPLVVGRATRLASLLSVGTKTYDAVIRLGVVTDTYDVTGTLTSRPNGTSRTPDLTHAQVETALRRFSGTFSQAPPPFSAKKIKGVPAYRLARQRRPIELTPVDVTVHDLELLELEGDRVRCRVICDPGFYMRSLAHDLGATLGCGACLEALRRERSGPFGLEVAVLLDIIKNEREGCGARIIPIGQLLPDLPALVLTDHGARLAAHGNVLCPGDVLGTLDGATNWRLPLPDDGSARAVKIYDRSHRLLAIAEHGVTPFLHPKIVLV